MLLEIVDQRGDPVVQAANEIVLLLLRGVVGVPTGPIHKVQIEAHLEKTDAALHESPGEQAALTELVTKGGAHGVGLFLEMKRPHEIAVLEPNTFRKGVIVVAQKRVTRLRETLPHGIKQVLPPALAFTRDFGRARQSCGTALGIGQIDVTRFGSEKTRPARRTRITHDDVGRHTRCDGAFFHAR